MESVTRTLRLAYLGNSCLLLSDSNGTSIVSDPYGENHPDGLADLPKDLRADAVTVSHIHPDHNHYKAVHGNPVLLTEPGEYLIKSIEVTGCLGWEGSPEGPNKEMRNVIFVFETNGIKIVQLGDSGVVSDPAVLEKISAADFVMVNIDGYVIPHQEILAFMRRIQARGILLAHYSLPGRKVWCGAPTADEFLRSYAPDFKVIRPGSEFEVTPGMPERIIVMKPLTLVEG